MWHRCVCVRASNAYYNTCIVCAFECMWLPLTHQHHTSTQQRKCNAQLKTTCWSSFDRESCHPNVIFACESLSHTVTHPLTFVYRYFCSDTRVQWLLSRTRVRTSQLSSCFYSEHSQLCSYIHRKNKQKKKKKELKPNCVNTFCVPRLLVRALIRFSRATSLSVCWCSSSSQETKRATATTKKKESNVYWILHCCCYILCRLRAQSNVIRWHENKCFASIR